MAKLADWPLNMSDDKMAIKGAVLLKYDGSPGSLGPLGSTSIEAKIREVVFYSWLIVGR